MNLSVVILAAGQGPRMRSKLPKVLHAIGGRLLLSFVVDTARVLKPSAVHIVYGHGGMQVRAALQDLPVRWVEQTQQLGTGHAVAQALPSIVDDEVVLVLYGDVPLTRVATLQRLLAAAEGGALGLMTARLDDPSGYGRIIRDAESDVIVGGEGRVAIGNDVVIGPNCYLRDVTIADGVNLQANSVIEEAMIGAGSRIGPFARIRPGTVLADDVHVGNFVEVKKSEIGTGSKVNHLSYIGDATIGRRGNVGAGTITCNYDGANKFQTVIEDDAFIGSDTQLIAPVTVGAGATIGAGSTISKDAPAGELTLSRVPQQTRKGWKRPVKKKAE